MMKTNTLPPCKKKLGDGGILPGGDDLCSAYTVVREVAGQYRYWRGIVRETQKDLLRFASVMGLPVYVAVVDGRPYFSFFRAMVSDWIETGGRSWIIAELEARSSKRVVAFPGRRS